MTLVKLTRADGPTVYVNPAHVVRVDAGGTSDTTLVTLSNGTTVSAVGTPAEIAGSLTPMGPDLSSPRVYD